MRYAIYTTSENDDWSNIAAKFYGSPFEYPRLLSANPDIPKTETLPAGLKIKIPEILENKERLNLPPWKKQSKNHLQKQ